MNTLTIHDLQAKLKLGRTKIYELIKRGLFPAGRSITGKPGKGSVRWLERDVDAWLESQFANTEK